MSESRTTDQRPTTQGRTDLAEDAAPSEKFPNRSCDAERKSVRHRPLSHNLPYSKIQPDRQRPPRLPPAVRAVWALGAVFLIGGFYVATRLHPDPRGLGTHQQLGLPPCSLRGVLGVPCPSCGMTTSFAHFVRGHFVRSAQANAAGFLLAVVCAAGIPWMARLAVTGRQVAVDSVSEVLVWIIGSVTAAALIQWLFRLLS